MKRIGIVLVLLGMFALVSGGLRGSRATAVVHSAPGQPTAMERRAFPLSPVLATIAIVTGLLMVVAPRRRAVEPR